MFMGKDQDADKIHLIKPLITDQDNYYKAPGRVLLPISLFSFNLLMISSLANSELLITQQI